jgi:MFS family permease
MSFCTSLEGQVTYSLSVFATSSFENHSLISTVLVVQQVINAIIKPPMAKVADVFGRLTAFMLSAGLYILGLSLMAAAPSIGVYAAAQIFYSAGTTGLQVLQQVFIADSSDLPNRALWSTLPDLPFLVTVWIGSLIGQQIYAHSGWRWGYALWTLVFPLALLPLIGSLWLNQRRARKAGMLPSPSPFRGLGVAGVGLAVRKVVLELDLGGMLLLSAAFALLLIPLTIAATAANGWATGSVIAMIVVGGVSLIAFPAWESVKKLAPHPLIPLQLLKSRTFCAGCGIGFFFFSKSLTQFRLRHPSTPFLTSKLAVVFYLSVQPYFYSYLLVVQHQSITAAGHITQTFSFTSTVAALAVSLLIKYIKRYKAILIAGSLVHLLGIGLMIAYRTPTASTGQIVGAQIVIGLGGGLLSAPAQLAAQASTRGAHQPVAAATAVFLTIVEIGGAVGAAVSGAVWSRSVPAKLREYLPDAAKPDADAIYASIEEALSFPPGSPERLAIERAYQETMQLLLVIAAAVAAPLLPLALLVRNYHLGEVQQGVRGRVIGGEVGIGVGVGVEREREARESGEPAGEANRKRTASRGNRNHYVTLE